MKKWLDQMIERLRLTASRLKELFGERVGRRRIICISAAIFVAVGIFIFGAIYLGDYYRADSDSVSDFCELHSASVDTSREGILAVGESDAEAGFIFYPGGKVEYTSYLPLAAACAERGVLCVLVEMPFNLAVLDMKAADGIRELYPEVERWYIGGHSLGGSMAASYLEGNAEHFCGLVLLGSYSTANLSALDVDVLSIYGSADGVMNREKYEKYKSNLPIDLTEIVLDGGNHAYFGMYGEQRGDGEAAILQAEQILRTADYIASFIFDGEN